MVPQLYFNCESLWDSNGTSSGPTSKFLKDTFGNVWGGGFYEGNSIYNIRGKSVEFQGNYAPFEYTTSGIASSNFSAINNLNSFSVGFWYNGRESYKPGYPNYNPLEPLPFIQLLKSGTRNEFFISLDYSGNFHYHINNSTSSSGVSRNNIDIGRWNFIYFEYDKDRSRAGYSINAEPLTHFNFSGSVISSGNLILNAMKSPHAIDEIAFWSGCISQIEIEDYYSNTRGGGYGTSVPNTSPQFNTHRMFPQSGTIDLQLENLYYQAGWFKDLYFVSQVTDNHWEYVNDTDGSDYSNGLYGAFPWYTSSNNAVGERKIQFNFGKSYVKPSSVHYYCCGNIASDYGFDGSGYLQRVMLFDKNFTLFASSTYPLVSSTLVTTLQLPNFSQLSQKVNLVKTENIDLSDVKGEFQFMKLGSEGYHYALKLLNLNLFFSGTPVAYTGLDLIGSGGLDRNSDLDLYTQAYSSGSRSLDLYTAGHLGTNSGIPLYIYGHQPNNSGIDLYMYGWDTRSSGLDLYIGGHIASNSGFPLYMYGVDTKFAGMNLFTKYEPLESSEGFGLFTFAADDPTVQRGLDLYLKTALASSVVGNLNLSISGPESGLFNGSMPLFLENNTFNYNSVELFLQNAYQSGFKGLRLYTAGEGTLNGGQVHNGSMPLFLERTEGAERGLSMFMMVNSGLESGLNMYVKGGTYATSGLDMSIPSTYANNSGVLQLIVRGY